LVEITNLIKNYGDKRALDNVSFSIGAGQVVGLLGLNGAGKTTTMNILTGYISATSGKVSIGGFDILSESGKAKNLIGCLSEQPSFYPEMRVDEHLDFICDLKRFSKNRKIRGNHISEVCERVGVSDVRRRMVRNLSKGYRQRVGFAQALIGDPKVLILDEPTSGLDPSQIIEIRNLIKECGKERTVIVSSHILSEVSSICNRVIVIDKGRVIADGAPANLTGGAALNTLSVRIKGDSKKVIAALLDVASIEKVEPGDGVSSARKAGTDDQEHHGNGAGGMDNGENDYIVTGKQDCDIREDVFRALAKADLPLLSSVSAAASLEDVFLRLTARRDAG